MCAQASVKKAAVKKSAGAAKQPAAAAASVGGVRIESDSMGQVRVPEYAYWGAQTQRAVENFSISPLRIHPVVLAALALVKKHAALVNKKRKLLAPEIADAIIRAADEVLAGAQGAAHGLEIKGVKSAPAKNNLAEHFPIDVFQTGSGTSWNMNINEVLSNRANEFLGGAKGDKKPVHPNDHVNKGQSSNDSIPSAVYIACRLALPGLIASAKELASSLAKKEKEFARVIKLGRTHLQDAVPMTLGQEFGAFAREVEYAIEQLSRVVKDMEQLPQGGTAVGTGLNGSAGFSLAFTASLSKETRISFKPAKSLFARMAAGEPFVAVAGALNVLSVAFMKVANDVRLLSSGAIGEIVLPALQPGSSIMPGKVNPVIPEMVIQSAVHLMGKAEAVKVAAQNAPLQLLMMYPIISHELLTGIELAARTCEVFSRKCIAGTKADVQKAERWIEHSLALVTPLAKKIGYDKAAALAHKAYHEKKTIREVLMEERVLSKEEIDKQLNPWSMV